MNISDWYLDVYINRSKNKLILDTCPIQLTVYTKKAEMLTSCFTQF